MPSEVAERFKVVAAVHLLFLREDQVLLLRRANTGYEDGSCSVPAGHLDGGETVRAAAAREALEECGVAVAPEDLEVVLVMHRKAETERIDFFLHVRNWQGEIRNAEPAKCDDLSWHPLDRLAQNVIPYVRHALESHRGGMSFCEFGWTG